MTEAKQVWTLNGIQAAMRSRGSHWWDPGTMKSFGTRPVGPVYQGPGGVYFVTSDYTGFDRSARAFTVRRFDAEACQIHTTDDGVSGFASKRQAQAEAKKLAAGEGEAQAHAEKFRPVGVVDNFAHDLQRHTDPSKGTTSETLRLARELVRLATRHHRLMEDYCNGAEVYDAEGEPRQPLKNVRHKITANAKAAGCKGVLFSGDPRGCTAKLVFADGFTNDFGGEGYCIPTADDQADDE